MSTMLNVLTALDQVQGLPHVYVPDSTIRAQLYVRGLAPAIK